MVNVVEMLGVYVRLLVLSAVTTCVIKCYKLVTTILLTETDAPLRVTGLERKKEHYFYSARCIFDYFIFCMFCAEKGGTVRLFT